MMDQNPAFSVVIPTRDRPDLLRRAVASALSSVRCDEVVIVDDGKIPALESLADLRDPRLSVFKNGGESGAAAARNFGISVAQGEVIVFLDDDDEFLPGYLDRVHQAYSSADKPAWGASAIMLREGRTQIRKVRKLPHGRQSRATKFRRKMFGAGYGFWIRRQLAQDLGAFRAEQTIDEDTDLCCRLLAEGHEPYYDREPGVLVYSGWQEANQAPQLTRSVTKDKAISAYRNTFENNVGSLHDYPGANLFLAQRYIRLSIKNSRKVRIFHVAGLLRNQVRIAVVVAYWMLENCKAAGNRLIGNNREPSES